MKDNESGAPQRRQELILTQWLSEYEEEGIWRGAHKQGAERVH